MKTIKELIAEQALVKAKVSKTDSLVDKMVVEESTFSVIEWLTSAIIGYVVMQQVNKAIIKIKILNSNKPPIKD